MKRAEMYEGEGVQVFHGNCMTLLAEIPDQSIDLIFADPPYNIGKKFSEFDDVWPSEAIYMDWCYRWLELCIQKLKPEGSMYIMASTQCMPYFDLWIRERVSVLSRIVWHYDSSGVQAKKYFGSLYEPLLFCVKDPNSYTFNAQDIEVER